jgi:hypothetical protein
MGFSDLTGLYESGKMLKGPVISSFGRLGKTASRKLP